MSTVQPRVGCFSKVCALRGELLGVREAHRRPGCVCSESPSPRPRFPSPFRISPSLRPSPARPRPRLSAPRAAAGGQLPGRVRARTGVPAPACRQVCAGGRWLGGARDSKVYGHLAVVLSREMFRPTRGGAGSVDPRGFGSSLGTGRGGKRTRPPPRRPGWERRGREGRGGRAAGRRARGLRRPGGRRGAQGGAAGEVGRSGARKGRAGAGPRAPSAGFPGCPSTARLAKFQFCEARESWGSAALNENIPRPPCWPDESSNSGKARRGGTSSFISSLSKRKKDRKITLTVSFEDRTKVGQAPDRPPKRKERRAPGGLGGRRCGAQEEGEGRTRVFVPPLLGVASKMQPAPRGDGGRTPELQQVCRSGADPTG